MASRNYPFNTVENSKRAERLRRRRRARSLILSICAVVILLLLSLIILLIGSIAEHIGGLMPDRPDLPEETTTNAQSGTPVYVPVSWESKKVNSGALVLVNDNHYFDPATVGNLIKIKDNRTQINGQNPYMLNTSFAVWMQKDAFNAMELMMQKYFEISEGDGSVMIKYSYRTLADQENLGSSVAAGHSDHHTGYCIALQDGNTENYPALNSGHWIYNNAYKFGFVQRYPDGKESYTGVSDYGHCFRYVGVPHATYMYTNDLCLEEYVQLLKTSYATGNHLAISGADGNQYEVYYVPASDTELTSINVPKDYSYTISGDNDSGFIVTVNLSAPNA